MRIRTRSEYPERVWLRCCNYVRRDDRGRNIMKFAELGDCIGIGRKCRNQWNIAVEVYLYKGVVDFTTCCGDLIKVAIQDAKVEDIG